MYLKRLEIQGFKSFADKVEFEFPSGITAIVGPNGSGKSNVVDSIRWVLGEQSVKNLRGSRMEDVIFAGSDDRRALGMAQVSLTLDNSARVFDLDYDEITVSRRLYRSGESEYQINRVPSRLRDIQELFMDTGLGREGFSIIGQGKVDEILSLKPEDRRGLIEEAAGIIKYKYRKREAERKLRDAEESLVRIEDILGELREREGPLGEQAEKARAYKRGKEELDRLQISLEVREIGRQQEQERQRAEEKTRLEDQLARQSATLSLEEANLSSLRLQLQQASEAYQARQQAFYELQSRLERRANEIRADEQILQHTGEQLERLRAELEQLIREQNQLSGEAERGRSETEAAEQVLERQSAEARAHEAALAELSQQLGELERMEERQKNAIFANMQAQAHNHNTLQRLRQEEQGGDREQRRGEQQVQTLSDQIARQKRRREELEQALESQQAAQARHAGEVAALEQEIEARKRQQVLLRQKLQDTQTLWQEKSSHAKALEQLEESGEGYPYGVRSVLEQKKRGKLSGILGTVSQLITVPQELEKAVETAMGPSLQNLVTESDADAQAAIAYLKKNRKGRATFLPLNTIRGERAADDLSGEDSVLGLAVDLVEFDARYEKILLHLLGRVWIVRDLASAVELGKKRGFRSRLVTLAGEVVAPGGALTGGEHEKDRGGFLARRRQIADLRRETAALAARMDAEKLDLDQYYAETGLQKDALAQLHGGDASLIREAARLEEALAQEKREEKRLEDELALAAFEQENLAARRQARQAELAREEALEAELSAEAESLAAQETSRRDRTEALLQEQRARQEQYNQNQIALAAARERWELLRRQSASEEARLRQVAQNAEQKAEACAVLTAQMEQYRQSITGNRAESEREQAELAAQNAQLEAARAQQLEDETRAGALEDQVQALRREAETLREENYRLELRLNQLRDNLASACRRLAQDFGCTYEEAQTRAAAVEHPEQAQKRIQQLKGELASLGEINFTAIEEYAQLVQRLEFLRAQTDDLQRARHSLQRVVQEMEKIMAQKFAETYQEVNAKFSEVFRAMFGGGRARLELSDPEDYLLTGIEIVAQPPGKKEQILTLLSGGERAMTAIAFLFSLLAVKPSPFCILDEIESALDDANIERFAGFIRQYAQKTQFILITHRKGTMEAADALYGVAMEEKGVSRLMSVKFSDYS